MNEKIRYHIRGTIHCIDGGCRWGQEYNKSRNDDNYRVCCTYEEAEAVLRARNIVPHKCTHCNWSNYENSNKS